MSHQLKITRRKLLEVTQSALLYYPLIEVLKLSEAKAAAGIIPRALFVHWSCGNYPADFWPAGGTGPLGALPRVTAPLEPHKADLLMFKGLCTRGDSNHNAAPAQVLAGWGKKGGGIFPGAEGSTPVPYSLDQMLADRWGQKTVKKSVLLGAATSVPTFLGTISYNSQGQGLPMQDNPRAAYDSLFGNFTLSTGGSGALRLASENVASGRKRIIDYLRGDLKKIGSLLGESERRMFEAHVTSLDELSKEIAKEEALRKPPTGGAPITPGDVARLGDCNPKAIGTQLPNDMGAWYTQTASLPMVYSLNRQIMLQALACGLTRVGVLSFAVSDSTVDYGGGNYHLNSHAGGDGYAQAQTSFMTEIAALIAGLKAIKLNDHTLFDETLIMGATDLGDDPNGHDGVNVAAFFAGRLGGALKGGRMIAWPFTARDWANTKNGMDYNRLLVTFAHLVGETDINVVGNENYRGVIPEIKG
jgi:hypothetical protein